MKTIDQIKIMQAHVDGKQIESKQHGEWVEVLHPVWNWNSTEYRIKENKIDWQIIINNKLDCEFSNYEDFSNSYIGKLIEVNNRMYVKCYMNGVTHLSYCRIRQSHIHFWNKGFCPLPKGLVITIFNRDNTSSIRRVKSYRELDWDFIIGFEVHGLADGWNY